MQFQHINHLAAYLESMDTALEQFEMKLKPESGSIKVIKLVKELRKEVHNFLAYLGVSAKKKNIYDDIHTTCLYFKEEFLVEMDPKRFQKGYGKLDSESEAYFS